MKVSNVDIEIVLRQAEREANRAARIILNEFEKSLKELNKKSETELQYIFRKVVLDAINDMRRNIVRSLIQ